MERVDQSFWAEWFQQVVSLFGGSVIRDKTKFPGKSVNMGIDGQSGFAQMKEQNARRGLRAHAGQREQVLAGTFQWPPAEEIE